MADSNQKHNSPKALVLVNATQHGLLTTESEMPPHFEEVKEMQIKSRVEISMESNLQGPEPTISNYTPFQGQGQSLPQFSESAAQPQKRFGNLIMRQPYLKKLLDSVEQPDNQQSPPGRKFGTANQ